MTTSARLLALLAEFEAEWVRQGAPVATIAAPGTDPERVRRTLGDLDLPPADDVVTWFSWHDGTTMLGWDQCIGTGGLLLRSLHDMAEHCRMVRTVDADIAAAEGIEPGFYWRPTWFPVATAAGGAALAIDCAEALAGLPAVYTVAREHDDAPQMTPVAADLTVVITLWLDLLRRHAVFWSAERGRWLDHRERVSDEIYRTGLF
jgi:cell wall assembly regulator SMI1